MSVMVLAALKLHPAPWRVEYRQLVAGWHPKSMPRVVDADGEPVAAFYQGVSHPGLYDVAADALAIAIVDAFNEAAGAARCPECGYTQQDCLLHGDHHLCDAYPVFPGEGT